MNDAQTIENAQQDLIRRMADGRRWGDRKKAGATSEEAFQWALSAPGAAEALGVMAVFAEHVGQEGIDCCSVSALPQGNAPAGKMRFTTVSSDTLEMLYVMMDKDGHMNHWALRIAHEVNAPEWYVVGESGRGDWLLLGSSLEDLLAALRIPVVVEAWDAVLATRLKKRRATWHNPWMEKLLTAGLQRRPREEGAGLPGLSAPLTLQGRRVQPNLWDPAVEWGQEEYAARFEQLQWPQNLTALGQIVRDHDPYDSLVAYAQVFGSGALVQDMARLADRAVNRLAGVTVEQLNAGDLDGAPWVPADLDLHGSDPWSAIGRSFREAVRQAVREREAETGDGRAEHEENVLHCLDLLDTLDVEDPGFADAAVAGAPTVNPVVAAFEDICLRACGATARLTWSSTQREVGMLTASQVMG